MIFYGGFDLQGVVTIEYLQVEACSCVEDRVVVAFVDTFVALVQEIVDITWSKDFVEAYSHMCFPSNLVSNVVVDCSKISKSSIE